MKKEMIAQLTHSFDAILQQTEQDSIEFCYARDLQTLLGYERWENFAKVITKAKLAATAAKAILENHFRDVTKMVTVGSGAQRSIADVMLTRYACYLIAQNGDPRKESIAFAQNYFALQTRKQEILEERLNLQARLEARHKLKESETELSKNIYERGVDNQGFARIRSQGDNALFGGHSTQNMKDKLQVANNRPLANFLPTVTIAAEITNHNVQQNDLQGENSISGEHVQNNKSVRDMLGQRGIKPEELPAEEDLQKLERRVKSNEKKMIKESELPNNPDDNQQELGL